MRTMRSEEQPSSAGNDCNAEQPLTLRCLSAPQDERLGNDPRPPHPMMESAERDAQPERLSDSETSAGASMMPIAARFVHFERGGMVARRLQPTSSRSRSSAQPSS